MQSSRLCGGFLLGFIAEASKTHFCRTCGENGVLSPARAFLSDCTSTHEAPGSHSNAVTSHQGQKGRDPRRPGWPPRTAPRSRDLQHSIRVEEQLQDGRHQLHTNK